MFEQRTGVGDAEGVGDGPSASADSPSIENDMTTGDAKAAPAITVRRKRRRLSPMLFRTSSRSDAITHSSSARSAALPAGPSPGPEHPKPAPRRQASLARPP